MPSALTPAERFEIAPVTFPYLDQSDAQQTLDLKQLQGFTVDPNSQKSKTRAGGNVDPLAYIVGRAKPTASITTRDIDGALPIVSINTGLLCNPGTNLEGPTFRFLQRATANTFMPTDGLDHYKIYSPGGGHLYPNTLSADVEDTNGAQLQMTFMPYWDGVNKPFEQVNLIDMVGIPTTEFSSQYFLGPIYAGGAEILGVTSVNIDFGLTCSGTTKSPGPYDRVSAVSDREPTVTFSVLNMEMGLANMFNVCAQTLDVYLQQGEVCGDRYPVTEAKHIKISIGTVALENDSQGGEAPNDATQSFIAKAVGAVTFAQDVTIPSA